MPGICSFRIGFGSLSRLAIVIDSTPPPIMTSAPSWMMWFAAYAIDCRPEEQKRFSVSPAIETGRPARIAATRAMLWPCEPCGWPQPMITSSTSLGSSCGTLPRTSLMVCAVKSSGRVMLNEPRNDLASGVRELATMTASLMKTSFYRRTSVGGAPASRDRKVRTASIDGRSGRDLDEVLGRSQPRLDGRARGSVGGIDPGVPGRVHVVVDAHVGHVHGGREDLRLVAADGGQGLVDLLEDLLGLALRVRRRIARHHTGEVHGVAVNDRLAQSRSDAVSLDGHRLILSTLEMGSRTGIVAARVAPPGAAPPAHRRPAYLVPKNRRDLLTRP